MTPLQKQYLYKNIFDYSVAILSLPLVLPVILVCWIIASIDTKSNGFFYQNRIGKNGLPFRVIKIKTMYNPTKSEQRSAITANVQTKISKSGSIFRKYKLDELPQILNILSGNMSFVGPRPDVPGYADCLQGEDRIVLKLKPGITGPASIKYKNEEKILAAQTNPQEYNDTIIWPDKVQINKTYYNNYTFSKDIKYILQTIFDRTFYAKY